MKKRFMALVLALVMCVGLAVPALAEDADTTQTPADDELTSTAYSTSAVPKGILLFVGYQWDKGTTKYPQYSTADIKNYLKQPLNLFSALEMHSTIPINLTATQNTKSLRSNSSTICLPL